MGTTTVLIHGGTFDERCWDRLVPLLDGPVVLVRQPGRSGYREDETATLTQEDYRRNVAEWVAKTEGDLVLVAHSLAGISVTAGVMAAPERVRHVVLLSAGIPEDGGSVFGLNAARDDATLEAVLGLETIPPNLELISHMDPALDEVDAHWAFGISVSEPAKPVTRPVRIPGWDLPVPKTWVRLGRDTVFPPELQTKIAQRIGVDHIVDLDAGHLAMISRPKELAEILNEVTASIVAR